MQMQGVPIGSVWSIPGLGDSAVVILAGPFATSRGSPEYLVAPLYTGRESGFIWTSEDVRLEGQECGFGEVRFAAIWNARPLLYTDLGLQLSTLSHEATVAVRDAYWASLNERTLGKSPRLGRPIRSAKDPAAQFQARELDRWEPLSGRVFELAQDAPAGLTSRVGDLWTLTWQSIDELSMNMETSDRLLGSVVLDGIGAMKAWLTSRFNIGAVNSGQESPDFFPARSVGQVEIWYESRYVLNCMPGECDAPVAVAADSELAAAA